MAAEKWLIDSHADRDCLPHSSNRSVTAEGSFRTVELD